MNRIGSDRQKILSQRHDFLRGKGGVEPLANIGKNAGFLLGRPNFSSLLLLLEHTPPKPKFSAKHEFLLDKRALLAAPIGPAANLLPLIPNRGVRR